ncbi:uncharacterized protein CCR75_009569 [Bremia lactucae]|uniref:Cyclic nucleotide-binding domain-containing protein n=1 Tax=Bremia lactucae TaxID=4779 RepID=A0A976FJV8_BRELC|nr:hypothetical protein CCR75_009569 [Bremia lactucae]
MHVDVCSRSAVVAWHVISIVCCFASKQHRQRDELKTSIGSRLVRDNARELRNAVNIGDKGDEELGSGDEDILTSLNASNRACRLYHREKRAHAYTRSRLVATLRSEADLTKRISQVSGNFQDHERGRMKVEDLEATVRRLEEKVDSVSSSQTTGELDIVLKAFRSKSQTDNDEANATVLYWKVQHHTFQEALASSNSEKVRLTRELQKVKKAAVLAMNRTLTRDANNRASMKRSYSSTGIV